MFTREQLIQAGIIVIVLLVIVAFDFYTWGEIRL